MRRWLAALAVFASCAQVAPVAPIAPAAPIAPDFTRTMRVDYFHSGGPGGETLQLDAVSSEGPWAGQPDTADRRDGSRKIPLRGRRSRVESRHLLARVCVDLRRMGNDAGISHHRSHLSRVDPIPVAGRAGSRRHQQARPPEQVRAAVGIRGRSGLRGAGRCKEQGAGRYVQRIFPR